MAEEQKKDYSPEQINEYLDHVYSASKDKFTPQQFQEYAAHVKETYGRPDPIEQVMAVDPINPDTSFSTPKQKAIGSAALLGMGGAVAAGPAAFGVAAGLAKDAIKPIAHGLGLGGAYEAGKAIARRLGLAQ